MLCSDLREEKATDLACQFLALGGGSMGILKLIKLLYLTEREALGRWGYSLTHDHYMSLPYGPVLSETLDLINRNRPSVYWAEHISERDGDIVRLLTERPPRDHLSPAILGLVNEMHGRYGGMTGPQLLHFCHQHCPEWKDPQGSSVPITAADILRSFGRSEEDIETITEEIAAVNLARSVFS